MSKAKFTPGPWVTDLTGPLTLGGDSTVVEAVTEDGTMVRREICSLMLDTDDHPDGPGWTEDAANCHLIAAAPDLYAACEKVLGLFTSLEEGSEDDYILSAARKRFHAPYKSALVAALAKARGEASASERASRDHRP